MDGNWLVDYMNAPLSHLILTDTKNVLVRAVSVWGSVPSAGTHRHRYVPAEQTHR